MPDNSELKQTHSLGLEQLPSGTFEHDLSVSERYQNFSTELLRLSLSAIGVIGLLVINNLFSKDNGESIRWLISHSSFGFWLVISLICFGVSAGLALLHLYFGADSKAYHLKYLRMEKSLGDKSKIDETPKREDFAACWELYRQAGINPNEEKTFLQKAADERDVRNFLLKISGKCLFYSGILLWSGAITLIFSFIPVILR